MQHELMTPSQIVEILNKFIIGQDKAKRAVAIALRNRWRRMNVDPELRPEITPKNILMIGPTGVGKTEIARRLATLAGAPFVKVEATKFTEAGYVGRDVESIIRDLVERAIKLTREQEIKRVEQRANEAAIERILDLLLPKAELKADADKMETKAESATRELFRKKLLDGKLDDKEVEIELSIGMVGMEIFGPPGMEEMVGQLQNMVENMANRKTKRRRLKVDQAFKQLK